MNKIVCADETADRFQLIVGEWAAQTFPGQDDRV